MPLGALSALSSHNKGDTVPHMPIANLKPNKPPVGLHTVQDFETLSGDVRTLLAAKSGGTRRTILIISGVVTILTAVLGGTNYAALGASDDVTQATISDAITDSTHVLETKMRAQRAEIEVSAAGERKELSGRLDNIERNTNQMAKDIAYMRGREERRRDPK